MRFSKWNLSVAIACLVVGWSLEMFAQTYTASDYTVFFELSDRDEENLQCLDKISRRFERSFRARAQNACRAKGLKWSGQRPIPQHHDFDTFRNTCKQQFRVFCDPPEAKPPLDERCGARGEQACGNKCIPMSYSCCGSSGRYCKEGICHNNKCTTVGGKGRQQQRNDTRARSCADRGKKTCANSCIPRTAVCCGSQGYCPAGSYCTAGGCARQNTSQNQRQQQSKNDGHQQHIDPGPVDATKGNRFAQACARRAMKLCGKGCIPPGASCCGDSGKYCTTGICKNNRCLTKKKEREREQTRSTQTTLAQRCAQSGYEVCGNGCMPRGASCCGDARSYCKVGTQCTENGCLDVEARERRLAQQRQREEEQRQEQRRLEMQRRRQEEQRRQKEAERRRREALAQQERKAWEERAEQREKAMDDHVATVTDAQTALAQAEGTDARFDADSSAHVRLLGACGGLFAPVYENVTNRMILANQIEQHSSQAFGGGLTLNAQIQYWPWKLDWVGFGVWSGGGVGGAAVADRAMVGLWWQAAAKGYIGGTHLALLGEVSTGSRLVGSQLDMNNYSSAQKGTGKGAVALNRFGGGLRFSNEARDVVFELLVHREATGLEASGEVAGRSFDRGNTTPLILEVEVSELNGIHGNVEFSWDYPYAGDPEYSFGSSYDAGGSFYVLMTVGRAFDWVW